MRVAGISVKLPSKGRPSVRLVVLNDSPTVTVEEFETFASDHTELPEQLHDTAEAIRSHLKSHNVDRVAVRRADRPQVASNQEGPRTRLLTEGAIVSAARSVIVDTRLATGKDMAAWYGTNKADLDAASAALAVAHGLAASKFGEAISAALAALSI